MNLRFVALTALPCVLLLFAACGDGPDDSGTPTAAPTSDAQTPGAQAGFGPAPVLGGNIVEISPAHGASVPRRNTITTNQTNPRGVCAKVTFDGLPGLGQSFRFIVDETDVTAAAVWIIATNESPKDGGFCYSPVGGLTIGRHTAAIGVQDPNNLSAPFKQIVAWAFDVTE